MIKTRTQSSYQYDVRCPNCRRKLMVFNISKDCEVKVNLFNISESGTHTTETRCHICKSFVAIDI